MTATEIAVVVGCLVLGYWLVAVFLPSLSQADAPAADGAQQASGHADEAADRPVESDGDSAAWYEVLEIPESSLREDITAAYKRKIRQYHPDLVARMGQELRELAEHKSKQINAAYSCALKLRSATYQA